MKHLVQFFLLSIVVSSLSFADIERDFPHFKCIGHDNQNRTFDALVTNFFFHAKLPAGAGTMPFDSAVNTDDLFSANTNGTHPVAMWLEKTKGQKWEGRYREEPWIVDLSCEKVKRPTFKLECTLPEGKAEIIANGPTDIDAKFIPESGPSKKWYVAGNYIRAKKVFVRFYGPDHSIEVVRWSDDWRGDYHLNGKTHQIICE